MADVDRAATPDVLQHRIDAVRALHRPGANYVWGEGQACTECGDTVTVQWPCPTILALAADSLPPDQVNREAPST